MTRKTLIAGAVLLLVGCNQTETSRDTPVSVQSRPTSPDNSNVNVRDRSGATTTPLDQGEGQHDVNVTADIRKQVMAAKLSTDAQNTKIITKDGKVTLRGPVQTADEKLQIVQIATAVAGPGNVDDQLEVKNSNR